MDFNPTVEFFKEPKVARVEHAITPQAKGRVFYQGTTWPARLHGSSMLNDLAGGLDSTIEAASRVTVIGRQGLTLLVIPLASVVYA